MALMFDFATGRFSTKYFEPKTPISSASKATKIMSFFIFFAFDAEEMGVLGSKYFEPKTPISSASKAKKMKKDMIFVAFDAEEMGVLGSKYFVENLPVAKSNIKAMFNYDMIGRMKADSIGISIGGTGTAKEIESLLHATKPVFATQFSPDGYGPSDHAPFYSAGIPVLFYSTRSEEHTSELQSLT